MNLLRLFIRKRKTRADSKKASLYDMLDWERFRSNEKPMDARRFIESIRKNPEFRQRVIKVIKTFDKEGKETIRNLLYCDQVVIKRTEYNKVKDTILDLQSGLKGLEE
jgi:hypothetical protein